MSTVRRGVYPPWEGGVYAQRVPPTLGGEVYAQRVPPTRVYHGGYVPLYTPGYTMVGRYLSIHPGIPWWVYTTPHAGIMQNVVNSHSPHPGAHPIIVVDRG